MKRRVFQLRLRNRTLTLGERTLVMGVLNVTPDSFSDGGRFANPRDAVRQAVAIQRAGADILDIGGESTRPGSRSISADEELRRVMPILRALHSKVRIPISIDTRKAAVADAALSAGAEIVNDVSALQFDAAMASAIRKHRAAVILMHMRGTPETMQHGPFARDVIRGVAQGLKAAIARARHAKIPRSQILVDPGIGFGKNYVQNFELLAHLDEFGALGLPLVVGPSRKAFIEYTYKQARLTLNQTDRAWGTAAAVTAAILGGAHIVRVHDVAEIVQVARVADRIAAAR
jgi:dihydropteroate synthase